MNVSLTGPAIVSTALLRCARSFGKGPVQRPPGDDLPEHVGPGRRAQSVGTRCPSWPRPVHHTDGHIDPALRHPHGFHRQLHRHHVVVHLAVLLPLEAQGAHSRLGHSCVRLFRHLPRRAVRNRRHLLFVLRPSERLSNWVTFLKTDGSQKVAHLYLFGFVSFFFTGDNPSNPSLPNDLKTMSFKNE